MDADSGTDAPAPPTPMDADSGAAPSAPQVPTDSGPAQKSRLLGKQTPPEQAAPVPLFVLKFLLRLLKYHKIEQM